MDIQGLRQSLKMKWLSYYEQNRAWLVKMRVWATYNGLRRPSSGFILATLSVLEPEFDQVLAFIMELNNDPDEIVTALGLNFNPDAELRQTQLNQQPTKATASNGCVVNNASQNQQSESQPLLSLVDKPVRSPVNINQVDEHKAIGYTSPKVKAVSTNGKDVYAHSVEMAVSDRTRSSPIPTTEIPVKSKPPSIRLALASETIPNSKTIRVLEITTKVPVQQKTLPLLTLATETPQTEASTHKFNPSHSTNATTLASWVDEFCQGTGFEREEVCSKDFR
ncbi:DUF5331 domain-containing protein [Anabaena azotica]|uniref:DUF5331 domain-containing protein n=1 Tax=Anabaena azotica FACHB-119 TaxID=947527 RepID=A0ABR8D875_9NOST|nr:DUF5331 domain-containing protein [Anabaena azotica]MBD2502475.1 hypothetical protein [Anabaena azotica FACHB-119]